MSEQNEAREAAVELLPCPFCNGEAMLRNDEPDYWYVSCNECINQTTHFHNGKDIVIERWNARHEAATANHAAEIERLIEANHRLQVALDSDYCGMCAERNGIFKHLESSALEGTPEASEIVTVTKAVVGRTYRDILERKENRFRRRTPADTELDNVRLEQFGPEVCYYDGGEIRRTGNIMRWRDSCQKCGYIRRAC